MTTYLIGYDLYRPGQDYKDLFEAIKQLGAWWHYLDSTWIVVTSHNAGQIRDYLKPYLDTNDELLVVRLRADAAWYGFDAQASDWLYNNIPNA